MPSSKRIRSDSSSQATPEAIKRSRSGQDNIPMPDQAFSLASIKDKTEAQYDREVKTHCGWASKAIQSMDVFQTESTLDELSGRPQKPKKEALDKVAELELKDSQVLSCKWVDKNGVTLGVYFSWSKKPKESDTTFERGGQEGRSEATQSIKTTSKKRRKKHRSKLKGDKKQEEVEITSSKKTYPPLSEQEHGRTLGTIPWELSSRRYEGLQDDELEMVQRATQCMNSVLPPHYKPERRHQGASKTMEYAKALKNYKDSRVKDMTYEELKVLESGVTQERADIGGMLLEEREDIPSGDEGSKESRKERTGVTHLVHSWYPLGHTERIVPSADMIRTAGGAQAVRTYFRATQGVSAKLAGMFKAAFPRFYHSYKKAFQAGVFYSEDKGPWIGRVIVWKLPVSLHRDGLDEGPAICFPCGRYKGGQLCLPDLEAKLEYKPGDVIIFMAGALFHSVTSWEPAPSEKGDPFTPGRISHVFFFPGKSFQALKDKGRGWAVNSIGGLLKKVEEDIKEEAEDGEEVEDTEDQEGIEESIKNLIV